MYLHFCYTGLNRLYGRTRVVETTGLQLLQIHLFHYMVIYRRRFKIPDLNCFMFYVIYNNIYFLIDCTVHISPSKLHLLGGWQSEAADHSGCEALVATFTHSVVAQEYWSSGLTP